MEIMDNYGTHIMITQAFYFIIHIIILIACIVIASKNRSVSAVLLVVSAALTLIIAVIQVFVNNGIGYSENSMMNMHTILMYLNLIVYLMFGLGLMLFAIDDWKKQY